MSIDEQLQAAWRRVPEPSPDQFRQARGALGAAINSSPRPASRRPGRSMVLKVAASAAGLAAIVGLLVAALPRGQEGVPPASTTMTSPSGALSVSLLERPVSPGSPSLPRAVPDDVVDPASLRHVVTIGSTRYFAARGRLDGVYCLVSTEPITDVCGVPGEFGRTGLVASITPQSPKPNGGRLIVGLVPDGIEEVWVGDLRASVRDNTFAVDVPQVPNAVTLVGPKAPQVGNASRDTWARGTSGDGLPTVTVPIAPPGVVISPNPGGKTDSGSRIIGVRLLAVSATPSFTPLSVTGTTIEAVADPRWLIEVSNTGDDPLTGVVVTATWSQKAFGSPVIGRGTIQTIEPNRSATVEIPGPTLDRYAVGAPGMLTVEISPPPGERNTGNNGASFPLTMDFG